MKNSKKIFTFLLITSLLTNGVFASSLQYSKKVRGKIMDDFKQEQFDNIYNSNSLLDEDVNFFETQNQIMIFENIKNNNKDKKEELTIQKEVLSTRVANLEQTIAGLDEEIEQAQNDIMDLSRNIVALNWEIVTTKEEIEAKNKEIYENKKVLLEYIAHIYKKQNIISSDNSDIDSIKTVLLNSASLWDILSELHFSSIMEVTGQSLIEKHRKLVKELFVKKLELEKKNTQLKKDKKEELIKRKSLLEKKDFREKILEYTKWKEELFQEYIRDKISIENKLKIKILQSKIKLRDQKEDLLKKYNCGYLDEQSLNNIANADIYLQDTQGTETSNSCVELNKILTAESQLKPFSKTTQNVFLWPVAPTRWLSAYFRDKSYLDEVWATHDAIDIRANQATDIIAPADWYVTYLREPNDEWYAYVVLKHADWFITVYGHVNEILVKQYDFVKAWEVFAKTWWEAWTNGAWLMTTWPHLHFEIYKDKEYVDPLNFLDLTELWDKQIPQDQKYVYKFYSDYKEKNWVEYEWDLSKNVVVFKLEWETEIDRQKDLLSKYATPEFNNWDMWVEESVDGNIDPSFLMCIWLAESWLWRNLKTAYNVWNIWNTDSWWTRDFENARSWVYWMVKTLNNKFLWEYNDMSKLSRYGNKTGSIYASSPVNWHNNMIKCLQALKDNHIPDNFNFRTN